MQINLPAEVVRHVLSKHSNHDDAMRVLQRLSGIRECVAENKRRISQAVAAHNKKIAELKASIKCDHEVTAPHGDPSGNGDTSEECLICGEWIR